MRTRIPSPAHPPERADLSPEAGERGVLRGKRVLVLEDELLVGMLIEDVLADLGCRILGPLRRPDEALALLARERPDLAILDINLGPGRVSFPVAEALAAMGVPFAFATGYGVQGVRADLRDRPTLTKPFSRQALEQALAALAAASTAAAP